MMAAAVAAAAMIAAGVFLTVMMVMVITADVRIEVQRACQEQGDCFISVTANTAVKLDAGLLERHLCAAADTAADQHICLYAA